MLTHARKEATISPQKSRPTAEFCRKLKKNRQLLLLMTLQLQQDFLLMFCLVEKYFDYFREEKLWLWLKCATTIRGWLWYGKERIFCLLLTLFLLFLVGGIFGTLRVSTSHGGSCNYSSSSVALFNTHWQKCLTRITILSYKARFLILDSWAFISVSYI